MSVDCALPACCGVSAGGVSWQATRRGGGSVTDPPKDESQWHLQRSRARAPLDQAGYSVLLNGGVGLLVGRWWAVPLPALPWGDALPVLFAPEPYGSPYVRLAIVSVVVFALQAAAGARRLAVGTVA